MRWMGVIDDKYNNDGGGDMSFLHVKQMNKVGNKGE